MKLSTREDIEVPLAFVWESFSDTPRWEQMARERGATLKRLDTRPGFGPGMQWEAGFLLRSKPRQMQITLASVEPQQAMVFEGTGHSFDVVVRLDFMALSARRTRVIAGTEVRPRNLGARVMLQSMKLARGRLEKKYEARVAQICTALEGGYRAQV